MLPGGVAYAVGPSLLLPQFLLLLQPYKCSHTNAAHHMYHVSLLAHNQVTRDNVPIIWHDDDVVFGAADAPQRPMVKDLTLAELQALCGRGGNTSTSTAATASATAAGHGTGAADLPSSDSHFQQPHVLRGTSEDGSVVSTPRGGSDDGSGSMVDDCGATGGRPHSKLLRLFRDRSTRQAGTRYEPWACAADDSIPTLEAVFRAMPPEIGFDIEVRFEGARADLAGREQGKGYLQQGQAQGHRRCGRERGGSRK